MDEVAAENLAAHQVTVQEILTSANKRFDDQGINIRYDLDSLSIKPWARHSIDFWKELQVTQGRSRIEDPFWFDFSSLDSKYERMIPGLAYLAETEDHMRCTNASLREGRINGEAIA